MCVNYALGTSCPVLRTSRLWFGRWCGARGQRRHPCGCFFSWGGGQEVRRRPTVSCFIFESGFNVTPDRIQSLCPRKYAKGQAGKWPRLAVVIRFFSRILSSGFVEIRSHDAADDLRHKNAAGNVFSHRIRPVRRTFPTVIEKFLKKKNWFDNKFRSFPNTIANTVTQSVFQT